MAVGLARKTLNASKPAQEEFRQSVPVNKQSSPLRTVWNAYNFIFAAEKSCNILPHVKIIIGQQDFRSFFWSLLGLGEKQRDLSA